MARRRAAAGLSPRTLRARRSCSPAGARTRRASRRPRGLGRRRGRRCSRPACRRGRSAPLRGSAPRRAASSTVSSAASAKARNSSFFETGSVSQPTATIVPVVPPIVTSTIPSEVSRPARLPACAMPFSRSRRRAASRSPSASSSARLPSIIPAPVWSRSSLTRLAGIVLTGPALPPSRAVLRRRLVRPAQPPRPVRQPRRRPARSARPSGRLGRGRLGHRGLGGSLHPRPRAPTSGGAVRRGRRELLGRDLLLPRGDPVGDRAHDQAARADRVVVARDHVVGLVRIAVRVDERDDRQPEPARLAHGELLLAEVDDEDRVRLPAHVGDAAEVRLELLELAEHRDALLRRQQVELALLLQAAQLVQPLDPVGDRAPVREQPAEPAVVHVRHADALGLLGDGVLALLLRADEEDGAAAVGDVLDEIVCLLDECKRLLEVDDVDPAALGEDEALHLRVPAARLVAEMDSGLQELSHAYGRQGCFLSWLGRYCRRHSRWNRIPRSRHRHRSSPSG